MLHEHRRCRRRKVKVGIYRRLTIFVKREMERKRNIYIHVLVKYI